MTRRSDLITPLDYASEEGVLDLALSNNSGEVAIHVVVATSFSGADRSGGLMHTKAIQRAFEWTTATFDQAIDFLGEPQLMDDLSWQSGRVPIEFAQIPPSSSPRILVRAVEAEPGLEIPVRVAWSVPGDAERYAKDLRIRLDLGGTPHLLAL
jgi:hypothetical protein